MIFKRLWLKARTLLNMNEWRMRLLGLEFSKEPRSRCGLILIQIDGLSHPDLESALARGHMPFLRRLMRREHYGLHPLYSGIPSNTPAFQGEFFFGQPQCVPAFQFWDRTDKKIFTMFEKNSAGQIEKEMLKKNPGLIEGGSAYCNIFSGGAAESHVCVSTADWVNILKAWNPYSVLISLLLRPYAILRGVLLCIFESVLALVDVFRGFLSGQDIWMELCFIGSRVFSSILVREIATEHARMDIYRGLPVIQVNYFGYDEQAHRRGPSSRFAYWSLSGIDSAIRRIWFSAAHARRRHYEVWIYSDHGQEAVSPFKKINGCSIQEAVQTIYEEEGFSKNDLGFGMFSRGNQAWGDTVMGKRYSAVETIDDKMMPQVTTLGPIAQVYFPFLFSDVQKKDFVKLLIEENPSIPLIAIPLDEGKVLYQTPRGVYGMPENAAEVLGKDHPYLEAVASDLNRLLKHEKCGDLVIFGWSAGMKSVSFSNENGAHAGLGPRETQAFVLLPQGTVLQGKDKNWIRPADLRQAALVTMGKVKADPKSVRIAPHGNSSLRVLSYNVHSCVGSDGILSIERIARIIAKADPDVVALQELDAGRRILEADQAAAIARELEMKFYFHPVCGRELQCFGNAILSRYPMELVRAENFPLLAKSTVFEPRGVLWVKIDFHGRPIHILNTHLSLWGPELGLQIKKMLGPGILGHPELGKEVILCGDFNMVPRSKFYRMMTAHFQEPVSELNGKESFHTWTSRWPIRRLDYIFKRGDFKGVWLKLPRTRLERYASDHLPIAADFEFQDKAH